MPNLIGPSHHIFYGQLHRRKLWLGILSHGLRQAGTDSLLRESRPFFPHNHLGIRRNYSLDRVIDDTPTDSFLDHIASSLGKTEEQFFSLVTKHSEKLTSELINLSRLFGEQIAQEILVNGRNFSPPTANVPTRLDTLYEMLFQFLGGGLFIDPPLLLRQNSSKLLEYETICCPHRRFQGGSDLACMLESNLYQGFIQTFFPNANFQRRRAKQTIPNIAVNCIDRISLP